VSLNALSTAKPSTRNFAELGQVANDALGFGDQGDEFHAPVAAGALQNVLVECSLQKLGPRAISGRAVRGRFGSRRFLELRDGLWLWPDARTPRAGRRQDACVLDGVKARWGHAGGEAAQQRQWVHLDRQCAVGKRALECDGYQAFGSALEALVGDRWSQYVAQQLLAACGVEGACARGGMQCEASERCAQRFVVAERCRWQRRQAAARVPLRTSWRGLSRHG
jgi:hypothetical protein